MNATAARAAVFDVVGTLFDLRPLADGLRAVGAPAEALDAWFERLLHTAASLTLAGEFAPFAEIAETTLRAVLARAGVEPERASDVLPALAELPAHADTRPALERLAGAGVRVATLTNSGEEQTQALLDSAGLADLVEGIYTTADVQAYKPHPAPYRRALDELGLAPADVAFVAAHGWDVVGARAVGMKAVWVDRLECLWPLPVPEPDLRAEGLEEAVELVLA